MGNFLKKIAEAIKVIRGKKKPYISAIIAAGGVGSRMNSSATKQMMLINGVPLVVHTMRAFEKCPDIDEIIVSAKEDEIEKYNELKSKYEIKKLAKVVKGGETRQQSVLNAFEQINPQAKFVAIHDAARCLITPSMISNTVGAAIAYGAACAGTPATDTIKYVEGGFVKETVDRSAIWLTQTPQIFKKEIFSTAVYTAQRDRFVGTDDSSLLERIDIPVKMIDCTRQNIKVTEQGDISIAETVLNEREAARR